MAPAAGDATQMAPAAGDATQMAPAAGDATQMAPAAPAAADATQAQITEPGQVGPLLAYSQEEPDYYEMSADSVEEFVPEQEDEAPYTAVIAPPPPRTVLMGSAMAFVVMSFTTLAVAVAVNIRPVADSEAQPVPAIQSQTVPGNYLPDVPHAPDPVALPVAVVSPQSAECGQAADRPDQHRPGDQERAGRSAGGAAGPTDPPARGAAGAASAGCDPAVESVPDADAADVADVPVADVHDHHVADQHVDQPRTSTSTTTSTVDFDVHVDVDVVAGPGTRA